MSFHPQVLKWSAAVRALLLNFGVLCFVFRFDSNWTHSNKLCDYSRYHSRIIIRDLVTLFKPQTLPSMHSLRHFTGFNISVRSCADQPLYPHWLWELFYRDNVLRRHGGTSPDKHAETSDPVNLSGTGRALMPLCTIHHSLTVPRSCSDLFFAHFKDFSFLLFVINGVNVIRGVCVYVRTQCWC